MSCSVDRIGRAAPRLGFLLPLLLPLLLLLLLPAVLCPVGCTDVDLVRAPTVGLRSLDVKLALQGSFFSQPAEEILFPVKVLFVVDTSQSMNVTDPVDSRTAMTGRTRAVQQVAESILGPEGVSMAVIAFNGATNILTQTDTDGDGVP
ncbi:MAG: VWA domain-containing protein, partial [Deltaproteobacteria bacterium]|nr:VWA domain-containing protein [Deltaproteobacteria bacterium]